MELEFGFLRSSVVRKSNSKLYFSLIFHYLLFVFCFVYVWKALRAGSLAAGPGGRCQCCQMWLFEMRYQKSSKTPSILLFISFPETIYDRNWFSSSSVLRFILSFIFCVKCFIPWIKYDPWEICTSLRNYVGSFVNGHFHMNFQVGCQRRNDNVFFIT